MKVMRGVDIVWEHVKETRKVIHIAKVLRRCEGQFATSTLKSASANEHQSAAIPDHFDR